MAGGAQQAGAIALPLRRHHLQPLNPLAPRAGAVPEIFTVEASRLRQILQVILRLCRWARGWPSALPLSVISPREQFRCD